MNLFLAGASGLLGSAVARHLARLAMRQVAPAGAARR